jgi:peptidoglycan/xylan/chitin deacetylase (PgdA/CDA1 family)
MLMGAYYYTSLPLRAVARRRMEHRGQAPLCVLFYHRVGEGAANDWSITPAVFRDHMRWLMDHVELVSLAEIQDRIRAGENDRVRVAVTFDDGYAENCQHAIPFLVEHGIPTTYFVSLKYVAEQTPFPHDVQAGRPLPPNTIGQLRELVASGIEIGAHTRTHCDIGSIERVDDLVDEMVTATRELGDLVNQPIRYFAFPYGQPQHLTAAAVELARRSGFAGVCSAYGAYNHPRGDAFHIRRFHADPGFIRLKNWVTIDPRKLRHDASPEPRDRGVRIEDLDAVAGQPVVFPTTAGMFSPRAEPQHQP